MQPRDATRCAAGLPLAVMGGMRAAVLCLLAIALPGCLLSTDGGKGGGDGNCLAESDDEPAITPAPLRNPESLLCDSFGGGCDPDCGPCPAIDRAPIPTWGICGSECDALGETECSANQSCRVVRDARCAIDGNCATDYVGCFPIDMQPDPSIDCFAAQTGWDCSRSASCTALHEAPCATALDPQCSQPFAMCIPEGGSPGRCHEPATCRAVAPACPTGTMPGVANGCWTGACIPTRLCEAQ